MRVYHGAVRAELLPVIKGWRRAGDGMVCPAAGVVCSKGVTGHWGLWVCVTLVSFFSLHDLGLADIWVFIGFAIWPLYMYTLVYVE